MQEQLHQRILSRIHRQYQIVTERVTLGPLSFDFTRIADPDQVLDQVADEEDRRQKASGNRLTEDELHLPYWAQLWDSAFGIGKFLLDHASPHSAPPTTPPSPASRWPAGPVSSPTPTDSPAPQLTLANVLDLGCGMGFAGTVAAALGARVLFADLETPALLFAALNSLPWRSRVRTRRTNWRTDDLGEQFNLIIGADILYERAQWPYLEPFWRKHLAPGGTVLLGEPGRQTGDLFIDWIAQRPWIFRRYEQPVPTRPQPIRIFQLTLPVS
ncbi:MAG: class I SAM-dependent methyltransferase [Bacillota bacterium]